MSEQATTTIQSNPARPDIVEKFDVVSSANASDQADAITRLKQFYNTFDSQSLDELGDVYADDVVFTDPVHVISGIGRLKSYFQGMCGNLTECRFEFTDEVIKDGKACLKWNMYYRHPKIRGNAPLQITGVSLIGYSQKIDTHQDFYDMGSMLYEHLPIIGMVIRKLKAAISGDKNK